jgi:hypothetical protein
MTKLPQTVGDTMGDVLAWHWDRVHVRFAAEHEGAELRVRFHKIGGRWSKLLPDGTPNKHQGRRGYWTIELQPHNAYIVQPTAQYQSADEAKEAVAELYRQHLRARATLRQGRSQ